MRIFNIKLQKLSFFHFLKIFKAFEFQELKKIHFIFKKMFLQKSYLYRQPEEKDQFINSIQFLNF